MPTYEYRCTECNHQFDVFQSIKARSLRKCPECEKPGLERLISGGGAVLFKGSGFYETDYRSSDYKQKAEAEKKSAEPKADTAKDSPTAKKGDGKTATKSESNPKTEKQATKAGK